MSNYITMAVIFLFLILGFIYKFTSLEYNNVLNMNLKEQALELNFLPAKRILSEGYTTQCIKGNMSEADLVGKENTIVFFLQGAANLSFDCSSAFYRSDKAQEYIQELYSRTITQCTVPKTSSAGLVYHCNPILQGGSMTGDGFSICDSKFGSAIFGCSEFTY